MDKKQENPQTGVFTEAQKPHFKPWFRVIAFVVIFSFLYQNVVWAFSSPYVFTQPNSQPLLKLSSANFNKLDVASAVRSILEGLQRHPGIRRIQFPSGRILELDGISSLNKAKIERVYELLKEKSCGTQALYDLLSSFGLRNTSSEVSSIIFSIDILQNSKHISLSTNPEDLENSLFAVVRAAEFFGYKLHPLKFKPGTPGYILEDYTPFIAHLLTNHYVVVREIKNKKFYCIDNGSFKAY